MSASAGVLTASTPEEAPEVAQESGALARVVAAAQKLEHHEEVDRWELSDDIREAIEERTEIGLGAGKHPKANTGLYSAIDAVNEALSDSGVISVGRDTVVGAYLTAKAWPKDDRVPGATYWAHYELRTREFDRNRKSALQKLVRQDRKGKVGPQSVRLWKSSRKPSAPVVPFLAKVEKRTRSALNAAVSPGWRHVAQGDRDAIAAMLKRVANEIANDEFPLHSKDGPSL